MHISNNALFIAAALAAMLFWGLSCGDSPIATEKVAYTLDGVLFLNQQNETGLCYVKLTRNEAAYSNASVMLDSNEIERTGSGVYELAKPSLDIKAGDTDTLVVSIASDAFEFRQAYSLPDTFSTEVTGLPGNIYRGSGNVTVQWNASAGATGYVLTVVPIDSPSVVAPYSEYVGTTSAALPRDAFAKSNGSLVVGTYDIYVLAYKGTFWAWPDIFFPIPSTFAKNITRTDITGTFGVGILSNRATVEVMNQ